MRRIWEAIAGLFRKKPKPAPAPSPAPAPAPAPSTPPSTPLPDVPILGAPSADVTAPTVPQNVLAVQDTEDGTQFFVTWDASSDTQSGVKEYDVYVGLVVDSEVQFGSAVTGTSVTVTGRVADTFYTVKVRARDNAGNVSAFSANDGVTTAPSGPSSGVWIYQDAANSSIEGIDGFGLTSAAGTPGSGPSYVYLITTNNSGLSGESTPVDTRTYECSLPFAFEDDRPNKVIIDLTSGLKNFQSIEVNSRGANVTYFGFGVRADYGTAIRSRNPLYIRGSDTLILGARLYQDDTGASPIGSERDCIATYFTQTRVVYAGCELYYAIDEAASFYDALGEVGAVETAFVYPLADSIHADGTHSTGLIFGANVDKASVLRCAFMHCGGRTPLSGARVTSVANSLFYNYGDHASQFYSSGAAHKMLVAKNLYIGGPDTQTKPIRWAPGETPPGSTVLCVTGNVAHNLSGVTSGTQTSYLDTATTNHGIYTASIPAECVPSGWESDLSGLDNITDTTQGKLDYIEKFRETCGVQPKTRTGATFQFETTLDHARARVNNAGSGYGAIVDTPTQGGGYPSPTVFTIVPSNSSHVTSYWGGHSLPSVSTRDQLAGNGKTNLWNWMMAVRAVNYGA